ncbi:ABC transporter substrate-binding protein [Neobacillus pocheonensis]|uniref:ABC transporter substrate-binding protein n=1 Tax=Neobacillus pocheonensis TaxID=363869 RepID=UPI003D2CA5CE
MRKRILTALMLVLVLILGACTQSSNGSGKNESGNIKVGAVLPLTGPSALYGQQTLDGAKLAAKMINDDGGILKGRKITLVTEDDQSKPELGVTKFKKLIESDRVNAITGGLNSSVTMATKDVAKNKLLNVVTVSKAPDIMTDRDSFRFRLNSTIDMDGKVFHKFIAEQLKPKTVAVIAENTDYGQAELKALKKNWSGSGKPKIVATEFFDFTETDFTNPLTKLKSANADALYVVGAGIEINSAIFKQAHQLGFNNTMKLLAPGNINSKMVELAGDVAEGIISADLYQNTIDNEMNKEFVAAFEKEYNHKPEKEEMLGFESIWFVAKAMDKAGSSTDYKAISKALESEDWQSPRGDLKFENGQALGEVIPLTVKDGKVVPYQQ